MAPVTWVPSDPSIQFKKYQLCSGVVCIVSMKYVFVLSIYLRYFRTIWKAHFLQRFILLQKHTKNWLKLKNIKGFWVQKIDIEGARAITSFCIRQVGLKIRLVQKLTCIQCTVGKCAAKFGPS